MQIVRTLLATIAKALSLCALVLGVILSRALSVHAAGSTIVNEETISQVFQDAREMNISQHSILSSGGGYAEAAYYTESTYYAQPTYQTKLTKITRVVGAFSVTGSISKGSGTFVIDHPLDPQNKLLYHSFVESPDVKDLYDGIATLDQFGEATIELPAYFEALNEDVRYQLKPIGTPMPNLYVKAEEKDNRFTIGGGVAGGKVSWQVTGIRHDPYILAYPIVPEVEKGPGQIVNKGEYLFPEGYASEPTRWLRHFWSFVSGLFGSK